jgi:hypothetical protein
MMQQQSACNDAIMIHLFNVYNNVKCDQKGLEGVALMDEK